MRKVLIIFVVAVLVAGRPASSRAQDPATEFGLALGAAGADLAYVPAKLVLATGGLILGTVTGVLTGGDVRSAYAVWVPAASGTYILTASHLDGTVPIEFFGTDYADRPSRAAVAAMEAGGIYEAQYSR